MGDDAARGHAIALSLRHLPNILTFGRLLAVPVTVWMLVSERPEPAFWLFIVAGLTDALDGALARLLNARTALGRYLDPLADKALLVSIYVVLGVFQRHIPLWLTVLVVSRDLLIVVFGLALRQFAGHVYQRPLFISKVNTAAQILLAGLVLAQLGLHWPLPLLTDLTVALVALTTLGSGLSYLRMWAYKMADAEVARKGRGDGAGGSREA